MRHLIYSGLEREGSSLNEPQKEVINEILERRFKDQMTVIVPADTQKVKPKKKVIQTPKLTEADRIKLIDRPELLVVIPKTFQASVRYGAGTKWCTSTPSNNSHFASYIERGFLVYILYYNVVDSKRATEKYKIALAVEPDINEPDNPVYQAWSKDDTKIDDDVFFHCILTDEMIEHIDTYILNYLKEKYDFFIGVEIDLIDSASKFNRIKIDLKGDNWKSTVYLVPNDIGKCVVTKINNNSVRADVKELRLQTVLPIEIKTGLIKAIKDGKLNINISNALIKLNKEKYASGTAIVPSN